MASERRTSKRPTLITHGTSPVHLGCDRPRHKGEEGQVPPRSSQPRAARTWGYLPTPLRSLRPRTREPRADRPRPTFPAAVRTDCPWLSVHGAAGVRATGRGGARCRPPIGAPLRPRMECACHGALPPPLPPPAEESKNKQSAVVGPHLAPGVLYQGTREGGVHTPIPSIAPPRFSRCFPRSHSRGDQRLQRTSVPNRSHSPNAPIWLFLLTH